MGSSPNVPEAANAAQQGQPGETASQLRFSEDLFQSFMDHSPIATFLKDEQGRYVYLNPLGEQIFGSNLVGKSDFEFFPPDIAQSLHERDQEVLAANQPLRYEERTVSPSGHIQYWMSTKFPFYDAQGRRYLAGIAIDVTERKQAEEELKESEERFRQIAENIREVFWIAEPEMADTLYVSPAYERIWGASCESLYQKPRSFLDAVHPDDRQRVRAKFDRHNAGDTITVEYRILRPDGSMRWIRDRGFPIRDPSGNVRRVVGIAEDMTEQKVAATMLAEAEERFRCLATQAPVGIFQTDKDGCCTFVNQRYYQITGLTPEQAYGGGWTQAIHPDDRVQVLAQWHDTSHRRLDFSMECRLVRPDGEVRWVITSSSPFTDIGGNVSGYIGTVVDVTQRKLAEDVIRKSENRLQAILNNTATVIYLKDSQGRYLMLNRRYEELFHITEKQMIGKTDQELFSAELAATLRANDQQVLDSGKSVEFEESAPQDDGLHTYVSVKFPIYDPVEECYVLGGISTDITERKRATEVLQAEREFLRHIIDVQEQERRLVAYEIHDGLVQYAAGALMLVETLRHNAEFDSAAEELDIILRSLRSVVKEGRRLINGIRTPVLDDMGVVPALQQLVMENQRADCRIELSTDSNFGRLPTQVEVALFRITQEGLTNAQKHSQSERVSIELSRSGDRIHLEIRDEGVGFNPAEPRKDIHGLRGMTERAQMLGGQCIIESSPGQGTRVVVELPCSEIASSDDE